MNNVWSLNIEDYLEIVRLSKEKGILPGESMEEVLTEYMRSKNKQPIAITEYSKDQIVGNLREEGLKILDLDEIERRKKLNE